ncbi:MAG: hypothetical protein AABN95_24110 [Acidobacteriota bacterium]
MSLLEPGRLIKDEGVMGAMRFALNVLKDGEAVGSHSYCNPHHS